MVEGGGNGGAVFEGPGRLSEEAPYKLSPTEGGHQARRDQGKRAQGRGTAEAGDLGTLFGSPRLGSAGQTSLGEKGDRSTPALCLPEPPFSADPVLKPCTCWSIFGIPRTTSDS